MPVQCRAKHRETYHQTEQRGGRYFEKGNFNDIDLEITYKPVSKDIERERGNFHCDIKNRDNLSCDRGALVQSRISSRIPILSILNGCTREVVLVLNFVSIVAEDKSYTQKALNLHVDVVRKLSDFGFSLGVELVPRS
ncbi:hypothetical protein TNCV_1770451 [Trichonephila clavipes]|nr:hypothetical protein TNCV_1770451 [Trichonephila clavipes]